MFTGIIHTSGVIESLERLGAGARLRIQASDDVPFSRGESVAVNGVCLTVIPTGDSVITEISNETLTRTTLGSLGSGARVNLERALSVGDRVGGHFVQGHIDTTGIPNLDYFVSCDAMEPPDAEAHYSETLVRLPGPTVFMRQAPLANPKPRATFAQ